MLTQYILRLIKEEITFLSSSTPNKWTSLIGRVHLNPIKKAYGYVTRDKGGKTQVLVFQHPIKEAGIQVPKGTVKHDEHTYNAVIREIEEETGLKNFEVEKLIAEDFWESDDGAVHNRFFYRINVLDAPECWDYNPTGGGEEEGLTFHYFWISSKNDVELIRGHGDYLDLIFV
ncbi:NUDIX domain-containing protein [Bacillus subtilis]|nr:NUDIX domain-containing protein [Bacillus subtilis]